MTRFVLMAMTLIGSVIVAQPVSAAIVQFNLNGRAGAGLLPGNEVGASTGTATGGELPGGLFGGIFLDDTTNLLTVNVGWGSALGFSGSMTGVATAMHIHGPTAAGGDASFNQNAPVKYGLDNLGGFSNLANGGGFSGTIAIQAGDIAALLNGQFYINVHTAANPGGEMRGNLVAVPEPSSMALLGAAIIGMGGAAWRKRKRSK